MNSQKRNIDVWLIYRCVECDSTYNLTLLSRTKPEQIKKEQYLKFTQNHETLARQYAFSAETARKNGVELDYSSVDYEILHDGTSIHDILTSDHDIITFHIETPFDFGLRLSSVIRLCLGLSANQLNKIIEAKAIFTAGGYPVKKHKIRNGDVVSVSKERLLKVLVVKDKDE